MSRVVIPGAGISGHTAAAYARKWLGRDDTVMVISLQRMRRVPRFGAVPRNGNPESTDGPGLGARMGSVLAQPLASSSRILRHL